MSFSWEVANPPRSLAELCDITETAGFNDELPQHRVKITTHYYLGIHEVTVGSFRQFVGETGYKTEGERDGKGGARWNGRGQGVTPRDPACGWRDPGFVQDDRHPVVNVSWNDAVAFCDWLSQKEQVKYRLPTETEWEYACRAGTETTFSWGDAPEKVVQLANMADWKIKTKPIGTTKEKVNQPADGFDVTAPVGSYPPNSFGLCDMAGNVWEWCHDWYDAEYYSRSPLESPTGPSDPQTNRIIRGGVLDG